MSTASLDTSIIVRILVGDNPTLCKKVLKLFNQDITFSISDLAISETIYVLETVYHKSREEISDLLLFFLARYDDVVQYNRDLTALTIPFYLKHPKLSFNDCALASLAELNHAEPLFTLDKKLATQHPSAKLA